MAKKKESKKPEKQEICEIFEIEKQGKRIEETACEMVEKKQAGKEELKHQNKLLRNILIGLGIFILLIALGIYLINSARHFSYRGISGDVVKEGKLIFYQIGIPMNVNGKETTYNIYIRNNPEKLDKIPFNGEMVDFNELQEFYDNSLRLVFNFTDEFDCDEDEVIAIANMINLKAIGFKVVTDKNATCDKNGRYIYINIKKADVSEINQIGNACYELNVKDCEILKVTERFMVEMLVKDNELRDS